jgi:radical SAM superfamily enzyme YgiQ (UPF0313 family)
MKSLKILLIYPPSTKRQFKHVGGALCEPLGLEYIASAAKAESMEVKILDMRMELDIRSLLSSFQPDVVGITSLTMHVPEVISICRRIKSVLPECKIVVGGLHATLMPEDFFVPQVDYIVHGNGVKPFIELLGKIFESTSKGTPCVWSSIHGNFVFGGERPPELLDDLPFPDRTLTECHRSSYFIGPSSPVALVRTSQGCTYRCNFCSLWRLTHGKYLTRKPDGIAEELSGIKEPIIFLADDEPFLKPARMTELATTIRERGISKKYISFCRIDTLIKHREMMENWRDLGLEVVFIGIEAISSECLQTYNKRLQRHEIEDGLKIAEDLGLKVYGGFIVNTNFNKRDFKELIRFIDRHSIAVPMFTVLTPLPGTDLLQSFDRITEMQTNGRPNWELFDMQHAVTETALAKEDFISEYSNLHRHFAKAYEGWVR